jgi:hypothetical protein
MAERVGFEPTVRDEPYTCFPSKRLRPLGHLSKDNELYDIAIFFIKII